MLVFCTFYIAWLSKTALFITLTAIACGFGIYYRNKRVIDADVKKAIEKFHPDLLLCSHVHEAEGIEEKIGKTKVISVGKKGKIIKI